MLIIFKNMHVYLFLLFNYLFIFLANQSINSSNYKYKIDNRPHFTIGGILPTLIA